MMAKVLENMEHTEGKKSSTLDTTSLAALLLSIFDGLALQKIMDALSWLATTRMFLYKQEPNF